MQGILALVLLFLIFTLTTCAGPAGRQGDAGIKGDDGYTVLVRHERFEDSDTICESESGVLVYSGVDEDEDGFLSEEEIDNFSYVCDGVDGTNGIDGIDGENGINGEDGEDGTDGVDTEGDNIMIIDPCGKETTHDEILMSINGNSYIAFFEKKSYQYLTELVPGDYMTSDGTNCRFTISETGEILD